MSATSTAQRRALRSQQHTQAQSRHDPRAPRRRGPVLAWTLGSLAVVVAVVVMMLTSRPTQSTSVRTAPDFTLTTSTGSTVSLADLRGRTVLLYPNEGVGCDACFYQMVDIEKHAAEFTAAGITVLPLVMNPVDRVRTEIARFRLRTPYLIDNNGSVSRAYGVLGRGMHQGLPGHGFVLIDAQGVQRWYGEYPSMYLSATDLLAEIRKHLSDGATS